MKLTPAQRRALELAAAGKLRPSGGPQRACAMRLVDAGLLQFAAVGGLALTDEGRAAIDVGPSPLADGLQTGRTLYSLTRAQMRIFKELRGHGFVWTENHRELTYQPLLDAELCYECLGQLRISPKGEKATIVTGCAVLA